jgi:hypothetical protein
MLTSRETLQYALPCHRKECQRADWPAHKPACKANQVTKTKLQVSLSLDNRVGCTLILAVILVFFWVLAQSATC